MGCGCKGQDVGEYIETSEVETRKDKIVNLTIRFFSFLFSLLFIPFIVIAVIWMLYKHIMISKEIDIIPAIRELGLAFKQFKLKSETEEDVSYDDDYVFGDEWEVDALEVVKK